MLLSLINKSWIIILGIGLWLQLLCSIAAGACGGATLSITGPDAPTDGSQYNVAGGQAPYSLSIDRGSINLQGVATVSGQCGTGTITATDACGNAASIQVRMPSGRWVQTYSIPTSCEWNTHNTCGAYSGSNFTGGVRTDWLAKTDRSSVSPGVPICPDLSKGYCVGLDPPATGACGNYANGVDLSNCWNNYGTTYGIKPVVTGTYVWKCQCNLAITDFRASAQSFTPSVGESVNYSGSISEGFGNPISWVVQISDRTFTGSGSLVSITWDGKNSSGSIVLPGTYTATLTAKSGSGDCADSRTVAVVVLLPPCTITASISATAPTIDPFAGGSTFIRGDVASSRSFTCTLTINGTIIPCVDSSASITWYGKETSGKIVAPGIYPATLGAQTTDGGCSDSKSIDIKVIEGPKTCPLKGPA